MTRTRGCDDVIVMPMLFSEVRECGAELLREYAAECSIPAVGAPEPQWSMYEALQASGRMPVFGAYDDLKLIGFAAVLFSVLPHYGACVGVVESLFVAKAYRASGAGTELMWFVEESARAAGCVVVLYSAPAGGKLEKVLDADRSYQRTNVVFCKALAELDGVAAAGAGG